MKPTQKQLILKALSQVVDGACRLVAKHGQHNQSTHGRGRGSSSETGERALKAMPSGTTMANVGGKPEHRWEGSGDKGRDTVQDTAQNFKRMGFKIKKQTIEHDVLTEWGEHADGHKYQVSIMLSGPKKAKISLRLADEWKDNE